jgi:class 3 adenylate cyclase
VIFALELQRRFSEQRGELGLRIGIASGDIILFQGEDYIGTAPNLAARLCDKASRFGILMPTYQALNLPEGVIAEPVGEFTLQGFDYPIPASRLVGSVPVRFRNDSREHWTRTPFAV